MKFDMDRVVASAVTWISALSKYVPFDVWEPGKKLKILMVGYNGKRNTGADARVVEMVEQIKHILGEGNVEIGVLTLDEGNTACYFSTSTRQEVFSSVFFMDLLKICSAYHMAVLCEGSCLKSKFANSLTCFFAQAAGIMKKQGKPCIAYGSEAGDMDPYIYNLTRRQCKDTFFISRTKPSLDILRDMGFKSRIGTDTAWTFNPGNSGWARKELMDTTGWDGKKPILGLCVINPFWFPVKPDLLRWMRRDGKKDPDYHYEKYYFYSKSPERKQAFKHYIQSIARTVDAFSQKIDAHVIIVAMDSSDNVPSLILKETLHTPAHIFHSDRFDAYQITALLRSLSVLVTSRYHARVLSMPGGVPSIAVSFDERLYNLLEETGHLEDYYLKADDSELESKLMKTLEQIWKNREQVSCEIRETIPSYLMKMADMGAAFRDFVKENFPLFQIPPEPDSWQGYLHVMPPETAESGRPKQ